MPPSPIPAPLPLWAKAILQLGPYAASYLYGLLTHGDEDVPDVAWAHVQLVMTRTSPTGTTEDNALMTFDIANVTGGALDPTWTTGDVSACNTALGTFTTSIASLLSSNVSFVQRRYYLRRFNPYDIGKPFADSGPPFDVRAAATVGSAGGTVLPYQVAATITERTPWPKHWGRVYVPGLSSSALDSFGRWTSSVRTSLSSAYSTLATSLAASDFFLVVPVTQVDKAPLRALLNVSSVQVDDIPDVQRRRRARTAAARTILP